MTSGAAEEAAEDVTAALILRDDAIADHHNGAADMIGDNAEGDILDTILMILNPSDVRDMSHNILYGIDLKEVIDILHNASEAFEAHPGIDIRVSHRGIMAVAIGIELTKDEIPDLHKPVAIAADMAIRLTAALIGAAIEIDFRARAAGAGADFPEVVIPAEAGHVGGIDADLIDPDIPSLVVAFEDGDIEFFLRDFQDLSQEFPSPSGSLMFEVVTEGEIAEHFEVSAVAGGFADIFDIRGTDTLLAGSDALIGRGSQAEEEFFHRGHAGVDEEQAGVILRDQRKRGEPGMIFFLKEAEEGFAKLIKTCPLHNFFPLSIKDFKI